jgi:hypothetical protein
MDSVLRKAAIVQHYMWMVDLLGHAVYLHYAKDLNKTMSCESNSFVWMTFSMLAEFMVMWRWEKALQKQVREHGDPEMGKHIVKTSSGIGLGYVLLLLLCYWLVR